MDSSSQHTGAPLQGYVFPMLKTSEIISCLAELGFDVTKDELMDPAHHKEKVRKIFTFLLEVCAGKTEEDFQATPEMLAKAATCDYPELHQDFSELQFYTALRDLMTTSGYSDFSWRDLHAPMPKRLRYQLSAVINLAKFREEQLKVYAELMQPRTALLEALEEVQVENTQLNEQLEQTKKEAQVHFEAMEEVVRECDELEHEIGVNNKLQAANQVEGAALKKKANELEDEVATAVWALQEAEAEEEKLRLQIVSSPDRRKSEMLVRQERLRKAKQESADLQVQVQQCKTKVVNAMQALQDLDEANLILDDLQESANKHTDLVRKLEETRKQYQADTKKTESIHKQIEEAERQLVRSEEKITNARKNAKLQMDAAADSLEMAKSQLLRVEKDRREGMARVEAGEQEVRALEAAMEAERLKTDAEVQAIMQEYQTVEAAFLERNQQRMNALTTTTTTGGHQ